MSILKWMASVCTKNKTEWPCKERKGELLGSVITREWAIIMQGKQSAPLVLNSGMFYLEQEQKTKKYAHTPFQLHMI
jgi:hypothetical protein